MAWRDPTFGPTGRGGPDTRIRRAFDSLASAVRRIEDGPPVGTLMPFVGATAPDRWVLCFGQTITNASVDYPDLWAVLDAAFKSGTSLIVPDLRGRIPVGLDNMGGSDAGRLSVSNTMGGSGGTQTHTLTVGEMPSHDHATGESIFGLGFVAFGAGGQGVATVSGSRGGGGAHNNMQPYLLLNWILKLK